MPPGLALASSISSLTFDAPTPGFAAITSGKRTSWVIGVKSLNVSYGRFLYANGLIACVSNAISSVVPSGLARATVLLAIRPPAPGLLSTTTVWPRAVFSPGCSWRATMSTLPPGGNGNTIAIGRLPTPVSAWVTAARDARDAGIAPIGSVLSSRRRSRARSGRRHR